MRQLQGVWTYRHLFCLCRYQDRFCRSCQIWLAFNFEYCPLRMLLLSAWVLCTAVRVRAVHKPSTELSICLANSVNYSKNLRSWPCLVRTSMLQSSVQEACSCSMPQLRSSKVWWWRTALPFELRFAQKYNQMFMPYVWDSFLLLPYSARAFTAPLILSSRVTGAKWLIFGRNPLAPCWFSVQSLS